MRCIVLLLYDSLPHSLCPPQPATIAGYWGGTAPRDWIDAECPSPVLKDWAVGTCAVGDMWDSDAAACMDAGMCECECVCMSVDSMSVCVTML
jgi:hypothetical protein